MLQHYPDVVKSTPVKTTDLCILLAGILVCRSSI